MAAARCEDLMRAQGLGPAKTAGLMAAFELGRRSTVPDAGCTCINGPEDLLALVRPLLLGRPQEES